MLDTVAPILFVLVFVLIAGGIAAGILSVDRRDRRPHDPAVGLAVAGLAAVRGWTYEAVNAGHPDGLSVTPFQPDEDFPARAPALRPCAGARQRRWARRSSGFSTA